VSLTKVDGQLISAPAAVSGALYTGSLATTPLGGATNPTIGAIETANNYIQAYAYNTANGTFSSADMVVYPNNGTDAAGWVDVGITSNNYSQSAYSITGRNEGYLFMSAPPGSGTSGNLVIGTDSTGLYNSIQMYTGSFAQGKTTPKWQLDGSTGNMQVTGTVSTPSTFGFKNRVINGAALIDQRNAGSSVTGNDGVYAVDRWRIETSQSSKFTIGQNLGNVTPPAGFTKYFGASSSSAYTLLSTDRFNFGQWIEGYNVADFDLGSATAQTFTLSFWVRSSLTGTFGGACLGYDGSTFRNYTWNYTINSANTWEYKTITITGDTSNTIVYGKTNTWGLFVALSLGHGSSYTATPGTWGTGLKYAPTTHTSVVGTNGASFYVTGIQLEKGSQATPFDWRSISQEVTLCQRYFQKTNPDNLDGNGGLMGSCFSSTVAGIQMQWPVQMRGIPAVTRGGSQDTFWVSGSASRYGTGTLQNSVISKTGYFTEVASLNNGSISAGMPCVYNGQLSVSAEL
jgi:hypothetical protein